jgi:hypothetical protein
LGREVRKRSIDLEWIREGVKVARRPEAGIAASPYLGPHTGGHGV